MEEPLIHATKLRKAYEGRPILDGIDLQLYPGKFYALLGHSGSGKTTLLYLLALLEQADEGAIYWRGQPLYTLSATAQAYWRNRNVGFVFQFFHLISELRVWENVALPAVFGGSSFRAERRRALAWLERVGMAHRAEAWPIRLSGGEQQRVAIARALFLEPPLILADEPTGNLDVGQAEQVWQLFLEVARHPARCVLVATHNPFLAEQADICLRLRGGKIVRER
ncbi:MAG: ABC transporter ATP-binding protein [Bacteroidia bacterium]